MGEVQTGEQQSKGTNGMRIQALTASHFGARYVILTGAALASLVFFISTISGAAAAIRCSGQFQIIRGQGKISTPYCEDNFLAMIARSYGWKVSNRAVRQNPGLKARICRHIGHDARLRIICGDHIFENDGDYRN